MSAEEKKLTIKFFITTLCILGGLWSFLWGWNWVRVDKVEARQQQVETVNAEINANLRGISADLVWIKGALNK